MELFYRKYGQGFPLIILHGLYGNSDNWITIAKKLGTLSEVFVLDQRNHGQSPHFDEHSYKAMADDLSQFMDNQEIEKAIILGHSMGGKTAMYFANKFPQRICKLIVVDIAPKSYAADNKNYSFHKKILETMLNLNLKRFDSFADIANELNKYLYDKRLVLFLLKNILKNKKGEFEWKINLKSLYNNINEIVDGFSELSFGKQNFPVLFLKGENSDYIQKSDIELINSIYPNNKISTIQNSGHWLHSEQTEAFINEVKTFLLE